MAYPAVAREGCVYHQGGLVALVHRFSRFQFYGSLSRSLGILRRRRVCFSTWSFRGPAHRVIAKNPIAIGGCLSLHWQVWSDEGAEPWVVEVLRWGMPDSLPLGSQLIQGSHPFTGVCPQFHQGQSSGGRGSGSAEQGCHRAGSASISRLLQLVIRGYESFRGVETGRRPFHSELEDSAAILQDGDTSIRSSLGLSGGLDGVSGLEGCVLAGANAPGFTQFPQDHGGGEGVPVQGTLLLPFHDSASFYQGPGSCFSDSTQDGGMTSSLPERLVASGILTRAGSPCSVDSAPTLQAPRDCWQLGEVSGDSDSADGLSGGHPGLYCFQGFSCPVESREASLHWRHICVLRQSASVILAGVIRGAVLNDPSRSWGRLRMRSLQLTLRRQWDQIDQSQLVEWSPVIQDDLSWWFDLDRLVLGVSLEQVSLSSSYGPTPRTWAGGLTWTSRSLQACGPWKTSSARSMHGSSWRSRELSSGLLHFSPVPQWRSSPTIRQPCRICGTKAGLVLLF